MRLTTKLIATLIVGNTVQVQKFGTQILGNFVVKKATKTHLILERVPDKFKVEMNFKTQSVKGYDGRYTEMNYTLHSIDTAKAL